MRILGLQPTDALEYRVITATKAPLAPDFYLFHTFAKDAIVTEEEFELDLPATRAVQLRVNPATPADRRNEIGRWTGRAHSPPMGIPLGSSRRQDHRCRRKQPLSAEPDVALTTFTSWNQLSARLAEKFASSDQIAPEVIAKSG